jgi:hypothetical protein
MILGESRRMGLRESYKQKEEERGGVTAIVTMRVKFFYVFKLMKIALF